MDSSSSYYRHSGRFSTGALALAAVVATAGVAVLSGIYPYLTLYIPIAGYVSFLITGGYAVGAGLVTGAALRTAKVRNPRVAGAVALAVAAVGLYVSWAVWMFAFLSRQELEGVSLAPLLLQPDVLWGLIQGVNAEGAWSIKSITPTGFALWALWAVEALIMVGGTVLLAAGMTDEPFCETCGVWAEEHKAVATLGTGGLEGLKERLERGDVAALEALGARDPEAKVYTRLSLHSCEGCDGLHALTVKTVTRGEKDESESPLLAHLLVSARQAESIRALGAQAPAAAPAV
jgi:hypothetical protein